MAAKTPMPDFGVLPHSPEYTLMKYKIVFHLTLILDEPSSHKELSAADCPNQWNFYYTVSFRYCHHKVAIMI